MNRHYTTNISEKARFEDFEVDIRSAEVRQNGHRIKLQEKSFQILALLLERAGDIVTREELKQRLWPMDPLIHFEDNLNTNLNRLRRALGDSANEQKFIRTIPRQGYRFCPPVTWIDGNGSASAVPSEPSASFAGNNGTAKTLPQHTPGFPAHPWFGLTLAFAVVLALGGFAYHEWLRHSAEASNGPHRDTILVTPFEDLSGDPSQQYLSDGLTAEMIARLGSISPQHLSAIARSTAMQYKGAHKPAEEMARETHADYVLEGSFQRQGDRVRITSELFRASDRGIVWTKDYDRKAEDLLTVQREVADGIAESLSLEVLTPGPRTTPATNSVDPEAYDAYLKGQLQLNVRSREDMRKSVANLELASQKDARFAPAFAALADAYNISAAWGYLSPAEGYRKAKSAAQQALAIDNTLADAHLAKAEALHEYDWDWAGAEQEYIRALQLNPSSTMAHDMYASYLTDAGRFPEAFAEVRRAQELDPSSLLTHSMLCFVHLRSREYQAGIQACKEDLELDPQFWPARVWLAYIYIYTHRYPESVAETRRALESSGNESSILPLLAMAEGFDGNTREAKRLLGVIRAGEKQAYVAPYDLADVYISLGDREEALAMLAKSMDAHDAELVLLATAPEFDSLRDDPRFQTMIKRIGFPASATRYPSPLTAQLQAATPLR
jgi:TolB-like protein/DNA-binding winged helix-turn-helix (wHTH) protein/tetratricopeptide (TPR) repeat protein